LWCTAVATIAAARPDVDAIALVVINDGGIAPLGRLLTVEPALPSRPMPGVLVRKVASAVGV